MTEKVSTPDITGYRVLSADEKALINEIKAKGNELDALMDKMRGPDVDMRWLSIARTDLQKGFMCLVRSVAQPTGF